MALNKKVALVAFDRQSSGKGTLAATATYGCGLRSGNVFDPQMEQTYEELTIADRFPPSAYRTAFHPKMSFTTRAWPRTVGLLLYAALGADSPSGAGDPWTHVITPGATPLYLTGFGRLDTEYHKIRDCRVDELGFTWDKAEPLEMSCSMLGTIPSPYLGSPFTVTNDDSDQQSFYPAGGLFQLDSDSTTPVTADITGGSILIQNHLEPIDLSRATTPDDNWPGLHEITVTLRLIPTDTTLFRSIITGADAGTSVSNVPVYGSFKTQFTISASRDLTLTATRMAWTGTYPEADPAGGPAELELTATVLKPAGAAFTATLLNQVASYPGS